MRQNPIVFQPGQVWQRPDGSHAFLVRDSRDPWVEIKCWRRGQYSEDLVLARGELAQHVIDHQLRPSPME